LRRLDKQQLPLEFPKKAQIRPGAVRAEMGTHTDGTQPRYARPGGFLKSCLTPDAKRPAGLKGSSALFGEKKLQTLFSCDLPAAPCKYRQV
jgi:hypothetical protein